MSAHGDDTVTWRQLWAQTTQVVEDRAAARWLCETAGAFEPDELIAALDEPATQRMVAHLDAMVARYRAGEPLQYALGRWGFRHLDLLVDRRVLIPRPETELVVETALGAARAVPTGARGEPLVLADLGTGSGAIGLALAAELPIGTEVWLTDVSADALDVATANLAGIGRAGAHVRVAQGSWFAALPDDLVGRLDVVVANPPYIAEGDPEVDASVADWEPHTALYSGADGLDAIREIVGASPRWLRVGGSLVLEIGHRQGDTVASLCLAAGLTGVEVLTDLAGLPRIVRATRR